MSKHCNIDPELGELGKSSFGVMKLGNATIGLSKLSELDEGSLRLLKLGELGKASFGLLKLGEPNFLLHFWDTL